MSASASSWCSVSCDDASFDHLCSPQWPRQQRGAFVWLRRSLSFLSHSTGQPIPMRLATELTQSGRGHVWNHPRVAFSCCIDCDISQKKKPGRADYRSTPAAGRGEAGGFCDRASVTVGGTKGASAVITRCRPLPQRHRTDRGRGQRADKALQDRFAPLLYGKPCAAARPHKKATG